MPRKVVKSIPIAAYVGLVENINSLPQDLKKIVNEVESGKRIIVDNDGDYIQIPNCGKRSAQKKVIEQEQPLQEPPTPTPLNKLPVLCSVLLTCIVIVIILYLY
ncbi:uncharacterized protein LOC119684996 [Teleopsis dalmanni]|uniref:uncharacterized protein LOC119684996 n=1 Tax=Teleopsis dalmanni TaxID=139649 RepID=UPI0018CCA3B0|nr:uncharacterized protein LOC119684996 [Teleopsis dalmanni]